MQQRRETLESSRDGGLSIADKSVGWEGDKAVVVSLLLLPQILTNRFQIVMEPSRMRIASLPYFIDDRVVIHSDPPGSSSGEQINGQLNPLSSHTCSTFPFSTALLMCVKFQVTK